MFRQPYFFSAEILTFLAGTARNVLTNVDQDADAELYLASASAISRNVRLRVRDATAGREWSDANMWLGAAYGTGLNPLALPIARKLIAASVLQHVAVEESAVNNSVRFCYHGAKLFPRPSFPRPSFRAREAWNVVGNLVPVAVDPEGLGGVPAGGIATWSFRVDGAAFVEWRKISICHNAAAPAAGNDSVATIMFQDSTGYRYQNIPVAVENLGATIVTAAIPAGAFPLELRAPALWYPGTVVTVQVQNLLPAAVLNMRIHLHGAKLYT